MLFLLNMVYLFSNEEYSLRFFDLKSFEFFNFAKIRLFKL